MTNFPLMSMDIELIPLASDALTEIFTVPFAGKAVPFFGDVILTVGGVVSGS